MGQTRGHNDPLRTFDQQNIKSVQGDICAKFEEISCRHSWDIAWTKMKCTEWKTSDDDNRLLHCSEQPNTLSRHFSYFHSFVLPLHVRRQTTRQLTYLWTHLLNACWSEYKEQRMMSPTTKRPNQHFSSPESKTINQLKIYSQLTR